MSSGGSVSMNIDADGENEFPGEQTGVGNAVQISVKGNELMIDADEQLQAQGVLQVQQQQSQGAAAAGCWDRFLPIRSIKVLLVENDDSTRHVVTALLRNCNYEVVEAANGLQAWRILEDLNNHVDLVLTEVVMPCLSGVGLLCKIMSHKTHKTIPVIMMSSHDSMGLVFKCLSKGAVDFLVKPIRKNELKNLWQHVWRRCHSSSGSASESGTQTQKSVSKGIEKSDNNSGSNSGEDNGSNGLNNGDGSDDGSGTQSSWTKLPVEVGSCQAASPLDQVAECPDSTCAQVIRPNAETSGNKRGHMTAEREEQEEEQPDHMTGDKDLVPGTYGNLESQPENPIDVPAKLIGAKHKTLLEVPSSSSSRRMTKGLANTSGEFQSNIHEAANMESSDPPITGSEFEPPRELASKLEIKNEVIDDSQESAIELSLKQLRSLMDKGKSIEDNLNVLRHSELSAFSRYNTSSNTLRTPNGITGSSYVIDNSSEVKKNSVCDVQIHSNENRVCQSSKAVSNNNMDMGSTTNKFPVNPLFFASESTSTINGLHPSSAFKLVENNQRNIPQHATLLKPMDMQSSSVLSPTRGLHQKLQIRHPQHHHHHQHHFHNFDPQQALSNHDKSSLKKLATDSPHCGSSNVLGGPGDGNPGNYSLNRSASGSNYGSNGQNGSSAAVNARGTNGESEMDLGGRSGSGEANGNGCGNRIDQNKLAQREAALSKFRQKRKERSFKKKVRYQNRKRLAEQRPRVCGQFVRQTDHENSIDAADD